MRSRRVCQVWVVPAELTNKLVEDRIEQPDAADGFILDGFPRSVEQAKALDEMLKNHSTKLDAVLEFAVSEDELFKRLMSRGRADDTALDRLGNAADLDLCRRHRCCHLCHALPPTRPAGWEYIRNLKGHMRRSWRPSAGVLYEHLN